MFREVENIRQNDGDPLRRIFNSRDLYLIAWFEEMMLVSYHLYYHYDSSEYCIVWDRGYGFSYRRVDTGEKRPDRHNMSALLIDKDSSGAGEVLNRVEDYSKNLEDGVKSQLLDSLKDL